MDPVNSKTALIKTALSEYVKVHQEYDINGRVEYIYEAKQEAVNGDPCVVTRYAYNGTTSDIVFFKEYDGTWNSAWEVF